MLKSKSFNKLYRCPPTPPPEEQKLRERSFVLDSVPVGHISCDYSSANPKFGSAIPPYNAQLDCKTRHYFSFYGIERTLKKTGQAPPGNAIEGKSYELFAQRSSAAKYLKLRNKHGSGRSNEQADGHSAYMSNVRPVIGYNGPFGFRRNDPWLRREPSKFGFISTSPLY
ncbi:hypothetical protein Ciccas_005362 [Cichlidogyrus casuarinus]|uniref:Uncharacterized protein n=1 Tax=Cichlidogyrus casuarinus TaxID=1844966 RepID=A0ABD2Q8X3_9PLAT